MRFVLKDGESFYFAGIWDRFKKAARPEPAADLFAAPAASEANEFDGFLILTTAANEVAKPIHNRMPVIVRPEMCDAWLDPQSTPDVLKEIVEHPRNEELTVYDAGPKTIQFRKSIKRSIRPMLNMQKVSAASGSNL